MSATVRAAPARRSRRRGGERGFSLVELLVSMAIGLILTLAVSGVLLRNEGHSRGTMAVNDINQAGAYVASLLDLEVRSAGSGFANGWARTYGCRINASRSGATLLPRPTAWPAPFAGFTQNVRVAPVIIGKGQSAAGSDVIAVMRGSAGAGEAPLVLRGTTLGSPLDMSNTLGMAANDLLLLADGNADCLLVQAGTPTVDTVPLAGGGSYHTTVGANRVLTDFLPADTMAYNLGNAGPVAGPAPNPPSFTLYAVGDNRTLFALDMLAIDGGAPQPVADGVVEMRALYGVDNDNDGTLDAWVDPGTSPFTTAALLDGSPAAQVNLNRIVAIRIGFVLRTSRAEREDVAPASLVLFADLDAALRQTRTLSADEKVYRHRTVEVTIPLRNVLMARTP